MVKTVSAVCFFLLIVSPRAHAADYYVSAAGNDANAGTSASAPWQSLSRASVAVLRPGDRVLLRGGETFRGTLSLDGSDAGTAVAPIAIASYGAGRAVIAGGASSGISIYDTSGISISNLDILGSGGTASGISIYNDLAGDVRLPYIRIDNVDVQGFGRDGIEIGAWSNASGFRDVRVTNSALHGNAHFRMGLERYRLGGDRHALHLRAIRSADTPDPAA